MRFTSPFIRLVTIGCKPIMRVEAFKLLVEEKGGGVPARQILKFKGQLLKDGFCLSFYHIVEGATVDHSIVPDWVAETRDPATAAAPAASSSSTSSSSSSSSLSPDAKLLRDLFEFEDADEFN